MPDYRRLFLPGGTYFFTVVTHHRRPIFYDDAARQCLRHAIREVQISHPFEMLAIALMPEHIHCIWRLPNKDFAFSIRWACIKKRFACAWIEHGGRALNVSSSRMKHRERGVWQKRFWEHAIRDHTDFINHINYIHYNPVKHALVKCPHQWPYSSFVRCVREGHYSEGWLCACNTSTPIDCPDFKEIESSVGE